MSVPTMMAAAQEPVMAWELRKVEEYVTYQLGTLGSTVTSLQGAVTALQGRVAAVEGPATLPAATRTGEQS
jgi:hypothetical protein